MKKSLLVPIVLMVSVFVVGTSEYLIAGLLPQVAADLDVSVSTAGQAVTAYALGVVVGGPLVTILTVRLPRKGLALGLLLLFAAGNAVCAAAGSYEVLIVGRVVASLSHAAFLTLALMVTTRVVEPQRVGTAIAAVGSGFSVATLLGVPLGVLMGESAGWRTPFAVLAGLALAVTALLAVVLPRQEAAVTSVREEVATVLGRRVLVVIATTAVGLAATSTVFTYLAPTLTEITGFGAAAVSTLLLVYGVGSLIGGLVAGRLADRSLAATVRGTFVGLAVVLAVFPFAVPWAGSAVVAVLVFGLLTSATTPVLQSLVLRHAGRAPTLAVSVNVCAFNIGIAGGSALGGGLVAVDGLRWLGLAAAVLSLAALAISYAAVPRRESRESPESPESLTGSPA
ncbi:MFS transporter [Nonomuraea gerenzanensis]|uniref:Putative transmembrane efflux protein n=1 Tax=Nonomuraea gerenzanensis TaxID=93944 RepID=A0A1M4DZK2_9ACTN|nr:MFS transporter [Nonomuraea gerenzanensis]UBU14289.1 MFS transporter [Nonomuraea gerenzanensis]SBO91990.1 putative transmembrane efflux protein [Nonomuraea gerenzanensis]